ncbi:NUDIX hydrolase [Candidatus Gottesmanbacteria bacterium]|nr:NUDIX hydrolase [Candidatus Gottesmanbacteria bacterium]
MSGEKPSPITPPIKERVRQTLRHGLDRVFKESEARQDHKNVVRIVPLQILSWQQIAPDLILNLTDIENELDLTKQTKPYKLAPPDIWFTQINWMLKGKKARNPNQLMLPGGNRLGEQEEIEQTAVRELSEELHLFGIPLSKVKILTGRSYTLTEQQDDKRIEWNISENIVHTEIPPFLEPKSFDQKDKAEGIKRLNPQQVKILFETGEYKDPVTGVTSSLLDSLLPPIQRNQLHPLAQVSTDGKEEHVRKRILQSGTQFEADIRSRIVETLLEITNHQQKDTYRKRWEEIKTSHPKKLESFFNEYEGLIKSFERSYQTSDFTLPEQFQELEAKFKLKKISIDPIKKRIRFTQELERAVKRVVFEHSLPFIERSGSQKPYILAQVLLQRGLDITNEEYHLIKNISPEVAAIFDTVCAVFNVDIQHNPNWYQQLLEKMTEHRNSKMGVSNERDPATESIFRMYFTDFSGINVDPKRVGEFANNANEFLDFLAPYLKKISNPDILKRLFPDKTYLGTSSIEELLLVAFGLNQYRDDNVSLETQSGAWTKLNLIQTIAQARLLFNEKMGTFTYHLRQIFERFVTRVSYGEINITENLALTKYQLNKPITNIVSVSVGNADQKINISDFSVFFYADSGDKNFYSFIRKILERGPQSINLSEEEQKDQLFEQITDFFRGMIVVDDESLKKQLQAKFPKIDKKDVKVIIEAIAKEVIKSIIEEYLKLQQDGYEYQVCKVQEQGNCEGILASLGIEPLEKKQYPGSAAKKIDWDWLKFVHTIKKGSSEEEEELQFFPSVEDVKKKAPDDQRFGLDRLLKSHKDGYYPPILIISGVNINKAYEEVMLRYADSKTRPKTQEDGVVVFEAG